MFRRHAYAAPADAGPVMRSGARLDRWGLRSVPSLRYLSPRPQFARHAYIDTGSDREDVGPAGGFMLDGRVEQLGAQALEPLLDPAEMANGSVAALAARLRQLPYVASLRAVQAAMRRALAQEAAAALAAFELEDPSFHPYSSRYDRYLEGQLALSSEELAGLRLFSDPAKGNCAACHTVDDGSGRRTAAVYRLQLSRAGRAAQSRHPRQPRSALLRSRPVRSATDGSAAGVQLLRILQDADPAQRRATALLLSQRPLHVTAVRHGVLREPRSHARALVSADQLRSGQVR